MVKNRFILPPKILVDGYGYYGHSSYSDYNYLRKGLASKIKRRHFEIALDLVSEHFQKANVIDFGCADGAFIPSLSHYFRHTVAIDQDPGFLAIARKVVEELGLSNVDVINNHRLSVEEITKQISIRKYSIVFLLEVLEHVGSSPATMYTDRMNLLSDIFELIESSEKGKIVVSVPKMVGLSFLAQYLGLSILGINNYKISFANLLKAGILKDTLDLEKGYDNLNNYHIGFNHLKLERYMQKEFRIRRKVDDLFQVLYVLERP